MIIEVEGRWVTVLRLKVCLLASETGFAIADDFREENKIGNRGGEPDRVCESRRLERGKQMESGGGERP